MSPSKCNPQNAEPITLERVQAALSSDPAPVAGANLRKVEGAIVSWRDEGQIESSVEDLGCAWGLFLEDAA